MPRITFCSIVLNAEAFILASLRQHYAYCDRWIIVEGADALWPSDARTPSGLSVDRTAQIIRNFPDPDNKIMFIQAGLVADKVALRNRYARELTDDIVVILDIDEFLPQASIHELLSAMKELTAPCAVRIPIIHLINTPKEFITGGYWDVPHNRAYRWTPGAMYVENHNHPRTSQHGQFLHELMYVKLKRHEVETPAGWTHAPPCFIHYGNIQSPEAIATKNMYYVKRGEAVDRPRTTADRAALLHGEHKPDIQIRPWCGPWPEELSDGRMPQDCANFWY